MRQVSEDGEQVQWFYWLKGWQGLKWQQGEINREQKSILLRSFVLERGALMCCGGVTIRKCHCHKGVFWWVVHVRQRQHKCQDPWFPSRTLLCSKMINCIALPVSSFNVVADQCILTFLYALWLLELSFHPVYSLSLQFKRQRLATNLLNVWISPLVEAFQTVITLCNGNARHH